MNTKSIIIITTAMVVVGSATFLSLKGDSVVRYLHAKSHELGMCASNCGVRSLAADQGDISLSGYTEAERKIIDYVCDRIIAEGKLPDFTRKEIEKATGVSVEGTSKARLSSGVAMELNRRNVKCDNLEGAGYCSRFSACSVDMDLSGATAEELERYFEEKSQDGATFTDWYAPDFTLPNTAGEIVSLSEYRGKHVALVFLAGHCSHSLDTLPILSELKKKYESQDLVILPVYVNSGSVEDVLTWSSEMDLGFPLIVSQNKDISEAYDSRMVPSFFLIDREGRVTEKYVGYKDRNRLHRAFDELITLSPNA